MMPRFEGNCLPCLIGSLPLTDYVQAAGLVWEHTPEIPLWVQLPKVPGERITRQFAAGMPGTGGGGRPGRSSTPPHPRFDESLLNFYEEALALEGAAAGLDRSRFAMAPDSARGFFELIAQALRRTPPPLAVKGQIIGPVTFGTSLCDRNGKAIFYDPQLRDASVRLLALRARWQVRRLSALGRPVLLFIDDPAVTGFGSSIYIGLSREDICQSLGADDRGRPRGGRPGRRARLRQHRLDADPGLGGRHPQLRRLRLFRPVRDLPGRDPALRRPRRPDRLGTGPDSQPGGPRARDAPTPCSRSGVEVGPGGGLGIDPAAADRAVPDHPGLRHGRP